MVNDTTNIRIEVKTKTQLDNFKIIPEETYNNAIIRLLNELLESKKQLDRLQGKNKQLHI